MPKAGRCSNPLTSNPIPPSALKPLGPTTVSRLRPLAPSQSEEEGRLRMPVERMTASVEGTPCVHRQRRHPLRAPGVEPKRQVQEPVHVLQLVWVDLQDLHHPPVLAARGAASREGKVSSKKRLSTAVTASGCSSITMCPASSITASRAPGMPCKSVSLEERGVILSWRPQRIKPAAATSARRARRSNRSQARKSACNTRDGADAIRVRDSST